MNLPTGMQKGDGDASIAFLHAELFYRYAGVVVA
jgi:hypothetical protein